LAILTEDFQEEKDGINFKPPRYVIEHKGMNFMLVSDGSTKKTLEGVIVLKQKVRGLWNEGDQKPICSSFDGVVGLERMVEAERTCIDCQHNQWGSGKGGNGKNCKEMRRVLIVEKSDDLFPVTLTIPPTSLNIFDNFISALIHKKIPLLATNIKFSLDPAEGSGFKYAKIRLELGEFLTEAQIIKVAKIKEQFKQKFAASDLDEFEGEGK
jgi:hypothetical protein